jgi:hypothetical protein
MRVVSIALLLIGSQLPLWPLTSWNALRSGPYRVIYPAQRTNEARQVLASLVSEGTLVNQYLNYSPRRVNVVLEDIGMTVNGYMDPLNHEIHLFTTPPLEDEILGFSSWLPAVTIHEYTHYAHAEKAGGLAMLPRVLFGNSFKTILNPPAWFSEGLAVYMETRIFPAQGRLNEGYYDAWLASWVAEDQFPSIRQTTWEPHSYPWGNIRYTTGAMFFRYLAATYGPDTIGQWLDLYHRTSGNFLNDFIRPTSFSLIYRRIYGKGILSLWNDFKIHEKKRLRTYLETRDEALTFSGGEKKYLTEHDGLLYYVQKQYVKTGPGQLRSWDELCRLEPETGEEQVIYRSPAPIVRKPVFFGGDLYLAEAEIAAGFANHSSGGWGLAVRLSRFTFTAGKFKNKELVYQGPIRAFCVNDRGVLLSLDKKNGFGSVLLYLQQNGANRRQELSQLINELSHANGITCAAARSADQPYSLYILQESSGYLTPLLESEWTERDIIISGDRLFFSANYGYEHKIYSIPLDGSTRPLSHTAKGYAACPAISHNTLYYISLVKDGSDVFLRPLSGQTLEAIPRAIPRHTQSSPALTSVQQGGYEQNLLTLFPSLYAIMPTACVVHRDGILSNTNSTNLYIARGAGIAITGKDAVGHFNYSALLKGYLSFDGFMGAYNTSLSINLLDPVSLSLSAWNDPDAGLLVLYPYYNRNLLKHSFGVNVSIPLLNRYRAGLDSLGFALSLGIFDNARDSYLYPFFFLGASSARFNTSLDLGAMIMDPAIGSATRDLQLEGSSYSRLSGTRTELSLLFEGRVGTIETPSPYAIPSSVRGYSVLTFHQYLLTGSLQLSINAFQLRFGSWYLQWFLEDMGFNLFVEGAVNDQGTTWLSGGLEAVIELSMTRQAIPDFISLGVVYTDEQQLYITFYFPLGELTTSSSSARRSGRRCTALKVTPVRPATFGGAR